MVELTLTITVNSAEELREVLTEHLDSLGGVTAKPTVETKNIEAKQGTERKRLPSICLRCSTKLTDKNWYPSLKKQRVRLCKPCKIKAVNATRAKKIAKVASCRTCTVKLTPDNWTTSRQKKGDYQCSECRSSAAKAKRQTRVIRVPKKGSKLQAKTPKTKAPVLTPPKPLTPVVDLAAFASYAERELPLAILRNPTFHVGSSFLRQWYQSLLPKADFYQWAPKEGHQFMDGLSGAFFSIQKNCPTVYMVQAPQGDIVLTVISRERATTASLPPKGVISGAILNG